MPIEKQMSLDEIRAAGADLLIQNLLAHAERMDRRLHIYERIIEEISRIYDNASTANHDSIAPDAASTDKVAQSDG